MRHLIALAASLVALLALADSAGAQGEPFAGEWRTRDSKSGNIVGANIYRDNGQWMVQLLGRCAPNPCVWNPEPLVILETVPAGGTPHGLATFQQANMRRVMTFRLGEDALVVEVYSIAAAGPSRGFAGRNYVSVDELARTKPTAARLPSNRPR